MKLETNLKYTVISRKLILLFAIAVGIGITIVHILNKKTEKLVLQNIDLAEIINVSGRQRMLSQNITKHLLMDHYASENASKALTTLASQFEKSHRYLISANTKFTTSDERRTELTDLFDRIESHHHDILLLATLSTKKGLTQEDIATLTASESKFLILMDQITNVYQGVSSELYSEISSGVRVSNFIIIGLILLFSSIVLLVTLRIIKRFSERLSSFIQIQEVSNKDLEEALANQEEKVAELELVTTFWKKAKEDAVRNGNIKSQFLSTMSHEIRTPMNAIIGAANLLELENPQMKEDERFRLLKISSTNLLSLINDILDYQKISSGNLNLTKRPFDLNELIENVSGIWEPTAHEKGLKLMTKVEKGLESASYVGDITRINQVLNNLINNALKFTEEGMVQLRVKEEEGKLAFEVKDTGIGIPTESLHSIFDQFSQVDSGNTQKVGGTGLGLAISQEIVKLMGGEIKVESRVDFGSVFSFTIDLEKGATEEKVEESTIVKMPSEDGAIKILLVEDNLGNQTIATGFLKQWGFTYEIANNGLEALDKISSMSFDLVLMDLRMPQMNGFDAAINIRARDDNYFKNVPIIALSASTFSETKAQIFEAGMNDFVSKPFNPKHLRERILEHVKPTDIAFKAAV